jgi:Domain of unknown function (DUF2017)
VHGWKRAGRGGRARLVATLDRQEAAVLRGLVEEVQRMLDARTAAHPRDELAELTGLAPGPSTRPDDPVLARLLPDFSTDDARLSGALRELHEPELIAAKNDAAAVVLETLPPAGGRVELTAPQADAWLSALNDVRLALGTALDVSEDMPDELPPDDPRAGHLGVYHWLTFVQDRLVQSRSGLS